MSRAWPVADLDPSASTAESARRILAVRTAEYFSYTDVVPIEAAVEEHHNLRISAKRLRYTLELFAETFGEAGKALIGQVKAMQEVLGDLHDHDVRIEIIHQALQRSATERIEKLNAELAVASRDAQDRLISAVFRPVPNDPQRGMLELLGREHARRRAVYQAFRQLWDEQAAAGVRADLVALSQAPITESNPR